MLNNILNLSGVTVLNKKQQGSINGGYVSDSDCKFTMISDGETTVATFDVGVSGPGASAVANSWCVDAIAMGVDRCFYDCEYDGVG